MKTFSRDVVRALRCEEALRPVSVVAPVYRGRVIGFLPVRVRFKSSYVFTRSEVVQAVRPLGVVPALAIIVRRSFDFEPGATSEQARRRVRQRPHLYLTGLWAP